MAEDVVLLQDRVQKLQFDVRKGNAAVETRLKNDAEVMKNETRSDVAKRLSDSEQRLQTWALEQLAEKDAIVQEQNKRLRHLDDSVEYLKGRINRLMQMHENLLDRVEVLEADPEGAADTYEAPNV